MRGNNRFCFCNVRYNFPFSYVIYLFSDAKLGKKEIECDLALSVFLANLTIVTCVFRYKSAYLKDLEYGIQTFQVRLRRNGLADGHALRIPLAVHLLLRFLVVCPIDLCLCPAHPGGKPT